VATGEAVNLSQDLGGEPPTVNNRSEQWRARSARSNCFLPPVKNEMGLDGGGP